MSGLLSSIEGIGNNVALKGKSMIDGVFPPEKRAELLARLQSFAVNNPKLSAFLLSNIALTGLPLVLFALFTITVFVFSLVAALLIGVLVAVVFTVIAVGTALLIVLPTTFFTTLAACFIFLWGLGGYYLLKWFNKGDSPAEQGTAIGDKINSLAGGRLDFLMDGARGQTAPGGNATEKSAPQTNGQPKSHTVAEKKGMNGMSEDVKKSLNVTKATDHVGKATGQLDGVKGKVGGTLGTVKGGVGGATGLI
ncbi:hypothetical protein LTR50_001447 [Elasticomyces elasticus]|nr:hypothetical protein LTR50_001447 [Elasticomyces elasticus]